MYDNRVRFTLITEEPLGSGVLKTVVLDNDAVTDGGSYLNWDDVPKIYERGTSRVSFITKYIEKLTFVKEAKDICVSYFDRYAPNGNMVLRVEIKNPYTDVWEIDFEESINMKTNSYKDEKFEVQILSGGLDDLIDAQLSQKYDLSRTTFLDGEFTKPTDINGNEITEIQYNKIALSGRKLKNLSLLENEKNFTHESQNEPGLGIITTNFIHDHIIKYKSDERVTDVIGVEGFRKVTFASNWILNAGQLFYQANDREKLLKITFNVKSSVQRTGSPNSGLTYFLVIAEESGNTGEYIGLASEDIVIQDYDNLNTSYEFEKTIDIVLQEGQALAFVTNLESSAGNPAYYSIEEAKDVTIFIDEDSDFGTTEHNALTIKEAFERETEIITGNQSQFMSDYFTNGDFKDLLVQSGKMVRNIPKVDEDNQPLDQLESMEVSLKQLLSISGYLNTGYGIELHNGIQKLVVEELKHFFRTIVTIDLGEVYDYSEEPATDYEWQNAEFGNDKAGEYEEQFGIYETNAKISYGFPTSTVKETYDGTSDLRSDLIGIELLRRKNFSVAPTEDTPYDKELFLIDAKEENNDYYRPRIWQDDFEQAPKKVYDPNSTGNLRLTPFRSLERHAWFLKAALQKFRDDFVRFQSGKGFTGMITKKVNEVERPENGNIQIKELDGAIMSNKIINCTTKLTYELRKQVSGEFEENSRMIPNIYGLASYTYKSNEVQYGWVLKAELMSESKFKLIKASL